MVAVKLLVIDDEKSVVDYLVSLLQPHFEVYTTMQSEEGLRMAYRHQPDLVLLDIMMPQMDGWEVCARLRELSDVPIIFLTARDQKEDIVRGLEMGADDYIVKPFEADELIARIHAHLRRAPRSPVREELVFDGGRLVVNIPRREVLVDSEACHLTPKEYSLLMAMIRNAGRVITRGELATLAWGESYTETIDSLKLYIHYLRQKIEVDPQKPRYVLTVRGVGYRFAASA
jgi:DNA-binding response OmpR family regulator